jgi:hypothetical protein
MEGFWFRGVLLDVRVGLKNDELKNILQLWKVAPGIPPGFAKAVWDRIAERERLSPNYPGGPSFCGFSRQFPASKVTIKAVNAHVAVALLSTSSTVISK